MKRLLVIYNICGISGFQNHAYYEDAIKSVLAQKGFAPGELKLVVSSCLSLDWTVHHLTHTFGNSISYNWITESVPLGISFNHTVKESVKRFGEFEGYLYLDSGVNFWCPTGHYDALRVLWDTHLNTPSVAITAALPSNDDGRSWWGIQYPEAPGEYVFKTGQTTNLHCQIYSEEFRKAYNGRLHCDIFANDTSESVTSYLCAGIERKFQISNRLQVFHNCHLDGASIGWRGGDGPRKRLMTEKTMDERYQEGYHVGFGYEECNGNMNWIHDPTLYDEAGRVKDPEALRAFCAKELFLTSEQFDYDKISHHFVEGA
jgi:hypothetical protein